MSASTPVHEATPLNKFPSRRSTLHIDRHSFSSQTSAAQVAYAVRADKQLKDPTLACEVTSPAVYVLDPELYNFARNPASERSIRTIARTYSARTHNLSIGNVFTSCCTSGLWRATVLGSPRVVFVLATYSTISYALVVLYYNIKRDPEVQGDFTEGIKDFVDLCVTGIVFLLGGFVAQSLGRWWTIRTECVGGLWNSLSNVCLIASTMFPKPTVANREFRTLVARYSLLCFQFIFIEAQAPESPGLIEDRFSELQSQGLLLPSESQVLMQLPGRSEIIVGWIATLFESALSNKSNLAVAFGPTNCDNGRFAQTFAQLFAAREAINKAHTHLTCQLPYGYVHLILLVVHATCLANSIFSGIQLGVVLNECRTDGVGPEVFVPLIIVRSLRIVFLPLLLDGMMVISTVISNPLGGDTDDFPENSYLEEMQDNLFAVGAAIEQFHPTSLLQKKDKTEGSA